MVVLLLSVQLTNLVFIQELVRRLILLIPPQKLGIPLAYAECSGDGVVRDFVVLQEDQNIVVKMNETKDLKESGWQDWYKIDVTQIVS